MTGITTRRARRTTTVGAVGLLVAISAAAAATASETVQNAPPVVGIVLDGDRVKLTGADDLDAGWVIFEASSTKLARSLWFFTPKQGVEPEQAKKAGAAMRDVRGNDGRTPTAAAEGTAQKRAAANAATVEKSLVALGGAFVAPGRPATFSLNLPEGEISISDLAAAADRAATPIASLMLGDPGTAVRSAGDGSRVSIGRDGTISAADSLARKGKLRISNLDDERWHFLGLSKLKDEATEQDVVAFYGGSGKSPFDGAANTAATAPLSGGREEFLDYDLPAGKYAIVDAWVDSKNGKFYAAQGAIEIVELR
jgi:hypothetical protein